MARKAAVTIDAEKEPGTAVINWQERLASYAQEAKAAEEVAGDFVSFKSGVMTIDGQAQPNNEANIIILTSIHENVLYPKFNPSQTSSPLCYAFGWGLEDEVMAPNPKDVKAPKSKTCNECPFFEWGSHPESQKAKACQEVRRLAWIFADLLKTPDKLKKAPIRYAKIPVMSVKNYSSLVNVLAARNLPSFAVPTRMYLVPDPKSQFRVMFDPLAALKDDDILSILEQRMLEAKKLIMFPYPEYEEPKPEPKTAQKAAARKKF